MSAADDIWLVALPLLVPLIALVMMMSALLERSGPIRLHHWAQEAEGKLLQLYEAPAQFELFRFLLSLASRLSPVVLFCGLYDLLPQLTAIAPGWVALSAFGMAMVFVGLVELTNRWLVGRDPEGGLRRLTALYRLARTGLWPVIVLLAWLLPNLAYERREEDEDDEISDGEIDAFIAVGTREGILEPSEEELVRSVVDFGETWVRSVMTPRIDMVCAPATGSLDDLVDIFLRSNHSRLPVYEDSVDQIVGIIHLRDLVRALRQDQPQPVRELAQNQVWFVPETTLLGEVLQGLQKRHQQMAIVVDEYGGTAGLVTIEDLVEEIVGDIVDETDDPTPDIQELPDGAWLVDGRTHVEDLDEVFELDLDDTVPYETVGGMIFSSFGHVPEAGESIVIHGARFTVAEVNERRIQTVRVERLPEDTQQVEVSDDEGR